MRTFNNLPVYLLEIDDDENTGIEVDYVALVDKPAIKKNFLAFSENRQSFKIIDEGRRIVTGALMIPNTPIYRSDNIHGEFYAMFSKESIEKIAIRFFKKGYQNNVNLMHSPMDTVEGLTMFESFITDESRGINPMKGFEDVPEGTWFASFKVENEEVWDQIREGKFKGFSIEGGFELKKPSKEEQFAEAIIKILKEEGI